MLSRRANIARGPSRCSSQYRCEQRPGCSLTKSAIGETYIDCRISSKRSSEYVIAATPHEGTETSDMAACAASPVLVCESKTAERLLSIFATAALPRPHWKRCTYLTALSRIEHVPRTSSSYPKLKAASGLGRMLARLWTQHRARASRCRSAWAE
eukprot:6184024-Pleurochrysis_carterae.AAC.2